MSEPNPVVILPVRLIAEALPDLAAGQVWESARKGVLTKTIQVVSSDGWVFYRNGYGWSSSMRANAFLAWARRTNARPRS